MPSASFVQTNFSGGEWSKAASGNITDPRYKTAMAVCLNGLPIEPGAWTRRPGSMHAWHTRAGGQGRVLPFDFDGQAPYSIEATDSVARFRSGKTLVWTNDAQTVSSVSTANPAVVTTAGTHNWQTGNTVYFVFGDTTSPLLQARQFIITVTGTTTFSISDAMTGANIDGSTLGWTTPGVAVTVRRVTELSIPYTAAQLADLRLVQSDAHGIMLHGSVAPQDLQVTAEPTSTTNATFSLTQANFVDGPYLDPIPGSIVTPSQFNGLVGLTFSFANWSSTKAYSAGDYVTYSGTTYKSLADLNVNNTPGVAAQWAPSTPTDVIGNFTSDDIGRHIRIHSEPLAWDSTHTYSAGDKVEYDGGYYTALVGTNTGNQPGSDATKWAPNPANALWSWGKITSLTGASSTLISRTLGTAIGNMTNDGGLAAAFDGTPNKGFSSCAAWGVPTAYVGKNYTGSAQSIVYGVIYSSNDVGYWGFGGPGGNGQTVVINLRAKQTAPSSASDGTLLGSTGTINNIVGGSVQINSSDTTTQWNYIWFEMEFYNATGGPLIGSAGSFCAQAQFYSTVATANGITIQLLGPDLLYTTASTIWRLGLFSARTGWPKCGTYHEGRLWLSGLVSNRLDASAKTDINGNPSDTPFFFTPTLYNGQVTDSCAIDYTLDAPDVNAVYWMQPSQQGIICGTQNGEWLVQATANNNILTPTSIQAHRVTTIGCANIEPTWTTLTLAFIQKHLRFVQEYFADVFSGKFTSPNLAVDAKHITVGGVEEISYQKAIQPIIWLRRADGTLIGCSYKRESLFSSQGPTYYGWHRHTLGSGRIVESLRVAGNADGTLDAPIMVTNDTNTNIRHVEVLSDIPEETDALPDAWLLDDAIQASSYETGTLTSGSTGVKAYGFWHLNGKIVSVFCEGLDLGDFTVSNGTIEIPYNSQGPLSLGAPIFTSSFVSGFSGAMRIVAGFTYNSDGQLLRPDTIPESGARNGPGFGKVRRLHKVAVDLVNTQGIFFGTDFSRLHRASLKTDGGGSLLADNVLFTNIYKDTIDDAAQSLTGQVCWRCTRPLPATVNAVGGFLSTQDE